MGAADTGPAIGMDLGTTYSAVAWMNSAGESEVIPDEEGNTLTPSVVSFASGTPVVGTEAKLDQATGDPDVMAFFKSSMGDPAFSCHFVGSDWTATDLSALVLAHLKAQAERALSRPVTQAVVTVPEYFTHPQRAATIEAGRRAGLDVRRIISEPTAAALAYGLRPGAAVSRFVVYDLGGGTFDVSVVQIDAEAVEVIAAAGDHELGGRDWDDRLAGSLQQRFSRDVGRDLFAGNSGELLVEVERLKRALSARKSVETQFGSSGKTMNIVITRAEFEEKTSDLLERTVQLTEQALSDAGLTWPEIDGVLPVGGSTRMPMIRARIEQMSGRPPVGGIHTDQAVVLGAAVQAGLLQADGAAGAGRAMLPSRKVRDIVAHSLGMIAESPDRSRYLNSVLLKRNTPIPCVAPRPYEFDVSGHGNDVLEVFLTQGENEDPADCTYLGKYVVTGFAASAAGAAVVDISYAYDENAVVSVSAIERSTGTALTVDVEALPPDVPDRFLGPPLALKPRDPATVYLAFDLSGSMSGLPLAEAKKAAEAFISQIDLTNTSAGLISFSDSVLIDLEASQNAIAISAAIRGLQMGRTGIGNAGHPFDDIYNRLHGRSGRRYAVVLADGVWENQPYVVTRAQRCHQDGIEIIAIGFGSADRHFLDDIASSTAQAFFTDLNQLTEAFSTIARELTENGSWQGAGVGEP
jgi:molecular chaperone DnaK (HSP70)